MAVSGFGTIFIQLDKGSYSPGEQVNGTVFLNMTQNFSGGQEVVVSISGMEDTKLIERKTRTEWYTDSQGRRQSRTHTYYVHHQDYNSFFNHCFPIHKFNTPYVPAGQYTFPISFTLQGGIPSTFNYDFYKHGPCHGKVNYVLQAYVGQGNSKTIHSQQAFTVNQELIISSGMLKKQLEKDVTSCCCIGKGKTKIVTYFEKNDYVPGEIAYMVTEVDNSNCKADISEVRGIFSQTMRITARGYSETIMLNHQTVTLKGIKAKECILGEKAERLQVPLRTNSGSMVQPTCRGRLVVNEYMLCNKLKIDAVMCCDKNPACEIVINVRNQDMHYEKWSQMPSNWDPQVMSAYNAQFTSEYSQNVFYPPQSQECSSPDMPPGFPQSPNTPMAAQQGQMPYPGHHVHSPGMPQEMNGPSPTYNYPSRPDMPGSLVDSPYSQPTDYQRSPIGEGMPLVPPNPYGSKPAQPGVPQYPPTVTETDYPKQP